MSDDRGPRLRRGQALLPWGNLLPDERHDATFKGRVTTARGVAVAVTSYRFAKLRLGASYRAVQRWLRRDSR
jgi:hypothetical protein